MPLISRRYYTITTIESDVSTVFPLITWWVCAMIKTLQDRIFIISMTGVEIGPDDTGLRTRSGGWKIKGKLNTVNQEHLNLNCVDTLTLVIVAQNITTD